MDKLAAAYTPGERRTARVMLALGMIIPGVSLAVSPNHWTTTDYLNYSLNASPLVVAVMGGLLALAGLVSLFSAKYRSDAYIIAVVFFGVLTISTLICLLGGLEIGAFWFAFPQLCWFYTRWYKTADDWYDDDRRKQLTVTEE